MKCHWITPHGLEQRELHEIAALLKRDDGFVWLDVPTCGDDEAKLLRDVFGFHPHGVGECRTRVPIPKIHVYSDHFFIILHTADVGPDGKVQVLQTATFLHESRYLVSVHAPPDPGRAPGPVRHETDAVRERIEAGRWMPKTSGELGHALVVAGANRLEACVSSLAGEVLKIENGVATGRLREYERMLESLFQVRHNLQAVRTIAATSREVQARMLAASRGLKGESMIWLQDLVDHFDRLKNVCDGEKELLQEITNLYQTRVANDLSQLVRKLTAFGAILVADTLIAGIYGMNFKHMPELDWTWGYPFALAQMLVISLLMAWWFRRKDWL